MNMNVRLEGKMEAIVDAAIAQGIVKTQMEAIRAGLSELNTKYRLLESYAFIPTEKISKKELTEHRKALREMEAGKEYSMEQVFGKK
jgi:Arc/MetJ-type ribon-helix-helix transcriptional regulator